MTNGCFSFVSRVMFLSFKYERLQTQEQDFLRQMFNLQGQSGSLVNWIYLFLIEIFQFFRLLVTFIQSVNWSRTKSIRNLTTTECSFRTRTSKYDLLRLMSIQISLFFFLVIQNKLEELIASDHQPTNLTQYEPYRLLRDMKEEQERNERMLVYLRRRLVYPNRYSIICEKQRRDLLKFWSILSDLLSLPYFNSVRGTTIDDVR